MGKLGKLGQLGKICLHEKKSAQVRSHLGGENPLSSKRCVYIE